MEILPNQVCLRQLQQDKVGQSRTWCPMMICWKHEPERLEDQNWYKNFGVPVLSFMDLNLSTQMSHKLNNKQGTLCLSHWPGNLFKYEKQFNIWFHVSQSNAKDKIYVNCSLKRALICHLVAPPSCPKPNYIFSEVWAECDRKSICCIQMTQKLSLDSPVVTPCFSTTKFFRFDWSEIETSALLRLWCAALWFQLFVTWESKYCPMEP